MFKPTSLGSSGPLYAGIPSRQDSSKDQLRIGDTSSEDMIWGVLGQVGDTIVPVFWLTGLGGVLLGSEMVVVVALSVDDGYGRDCWS